MSTTLPFSGSVRVARCPGLMQLAPAETGKPEPGYMPRFYLLYLLSSPRRAGCADIQGFWLGMPGSAVAGLRVRGLLYASRTADEFSQILNLKITMPYWPWRVPIRSTLKLLQ